MERGIVHCIQWRDTRDMTADGHTKESIDREMLLQVMGAAGGVLACTVKCRQGNVRAGPPSLRTRLFAALLYIVAAVPAV
eukprot:6220733-Pyramimonas_sp.AAC.2